MADPSEKTMLQAVSTGDELAFERAYGCYAERARLVAWRVSHRADWVDDILNESWCRAFDQRTAFDPERPFLVWLTGIIRNVYRESCRKSPLTLDGVGDERPGEVDRQDPGQIAHEAEVLAGLNECLVRLSAADARIIRWRYFEGRTLREVAKEAGVPESTLRDSRIPDLLGRLRRCLHEKEIEFSEIFSAQGPDEVQ